ncbi:hypothetical protein [Pseudemcibacter aquimaris]|uniref:hypothetical protein n=1 Tax=Pseudemcibacter aquimaris TaxID=2857064 RepID=UPI002010F530|nr:hypothetical protein [Pseudemcibacter aquimaris]MCC3859766.1 hypothetical protein [Pseudemcibacter aquimaris]WDU60160.1 hypothetical protein KW060_07805 [Pseudemcibacter aquimaris]
MNHIERYHNSHKGFGNRPLTSEHARIAIGGKDLPAAVGAINVSRLWDDTIGVEIDPKAWGKSEEQSNHLKAQSEQIARRLEGQGVNMHIEGQTSVIGVCTGVIEKTIQYRNSNIIPVMQSRNVHDISKHVRFFADMTNKKTLRMLVISGGWVDLENYREAHKAHTRRISKFAAHERVKEAGIEFCYYNVENTIKRENGAARLNLHSHVLIKSTKRLGPKKWGEFMAWARSQFPKGYIHDSKIKNVQEVVKYVFKPAEFDRLTDEELAALFYQTHRLKFFHPLGEIREFRKHLEDNKHKLVKVPPDSDIEAIEQLGNDKDDWQWCVMPKATPKQREKREGPSEDVDNVLMAITTPSPKFSNRFEPCLVVHNFDGNLDGLIEQEGIGPLIEKARRLWHERASMRHTTTATVRANKKKMSAKRQYRKPDNLPPYVRPEFNENHSSATIN